MDALKVLIAATLAAAFIAGSAASTAANTQQLLDEEEDCLEAAPESYSIPSVTDDGREVILEVHTLLDSVSMTDGEATMAAAARAYAEINVKLVATFEEVEFPADGTDPDGRGTLDPDDAFMFAREHTGEYRPHGSDVVYVMTSKELVSDSAIGSAVAGQADCIGGIRYPGRAFAVGEVSPDDPASDYWYGSIVAGHEIGHLLGAHHHYANCAQGNPDDVVEYWTSCTLMFNTVTFISRRFSTVEGAVVRGHALSFADKTATGTPELVSRTVGLKIRKGRASGAIEMEEQVAGCQDSVQVQIQRAIRGEWVTVEETTTNPDGSFKVEVENRRGSYRAWLGETIAHDGTVWRTCEETISETLEVKG